MAAAVAALGIGTASADEAPAGDAGQLEQVVVSAQRRTESAQNVPISITAISGNQLAAAAVTSLPDVAQLTPGLQFQAIGASSVPFLRGVGATVSSSGSESTVALVVDGVYLSAQPASLMSLNNLESVEVDKGPQGTLFGRNATGGVIQLHTRRPSQQSRLEVSLGYGNYQTADASVYGTTGITPTLAADVFLSYHDQNRGFGANLFNGSEVYNSYDYMARSKWLWTPTDSTEVTFIGDWERLLSETGFATRLPADGELGLDQRGAGGFQYAGGFYDVDLNYPSYNISQTRGGSIDWLQRMGFANFRSITAYHTQNVDGHVDFDLSPNSGSHQLFQPFQRTFSQELQLLSPETSALSWVAGLYYYRDNSGYDPVFIDYPQPNGANLHDTTIRSEMRTRSWASFGQTTIPLPADFRLTLGIRYTNDKRDLNLHQSAAAAPPATVAQTGSATWPKTTYRAGLDHHLTADSLAYFQFSTGFKSGLFNTQTLQSPPGQPTTVALPVQPEKINAYEVGLKSDWLEHRLRFNIAGFYYDYKDQQVNAFLGSTRTLLNAASSKIKGIDFELTGRPSEVLTLSWSGSYLHARYDSFPTAPLFVPVPAPGIGNLASPRDASGKDVVNSPAFTTTLAANYGIPLGATRLDLNANAYYNSGYYFDFANTRHQGSYTWLNSSVKWTFGDNAQYSLGLYGTNLLDKEVYSSVNQVGAGPAGLFGGDSLTVRPPRTYGARVQAIF
jgi:iron complex outermembrane receptor protein